jgi:FkbM family methyltransferase
MTIFKSHTIFDIVRSYLPDNPTIIEAGAFDGRDTKKFLYYWPNSTIHAFEPVPAIFKKLELNTVGCPQIKRYPMALSTINGTASFYIAEKPTNPGIPTQAGSLLSPKERLNHSPIQFPYTIQVPTITLDTWAHQQQVTHIDMLWLDLQGHELSVMRASPHIFATVKIIHTEVSFIESYANQPQYPEVRAWLEDQGFTLLGTDFTQPPTWFFGNALFARI